MNPKTIKYLLCALATLCLAAFTACKGNGKLGNFGGDKVNSVSVSRLEKAINDAAKDLPAQVSPYIELTDMKYENGDVVITSTVDDDVYKIDALAANKNLGRENVKAFLASEDPDTQKLVSLIHECRANIRFVYVGRNSGKTVKISISSDEINNLDPDDVDYEDIIDNSVTMVNAQCPLILDEYTTLVTVKKERDNIVYHYRLNDLYVDDLNATQWNAIKQSVKNELSGPANRGLREALTQTGRDVKCVYVDEAGYKHDFEITVN